MSNDSDDQTTNADADTDVDVDDNGDSKNEQIERRLWGRRKVLKTGAGSVVALGLIGTSMAQSGDWTELIISDPDGSDLNDYSFAVTGQVERLSDPQGDDVTSDGTEASGTVAGGQDGYRYTGEIVSFSYEPEIEVTIDGEPTDPDTLGGSEPPADDDDPETNDPSVHQLWLSGDGPETRYRLEVSGTLEEDPDGPGGVNDHDDLSGSSVDGILYGGTDPYRFTGEIVTFEVTDGDANNISAQYDGESVSVNDIEGLGTSTGEDDRRYLNIIAQNESAEVWFTVSGNLEAGPKFDTDGSDSISGPSANVTLAGTGTDDFYFTGEITDWRNEGDVAVEIDDTEIPLSDLPEVEDGGSDGGENGNGDGGDADTDTEHELRVQAVGESGRIELSVSGSIRPGDRFDDGTDSISPDGQTAILTFGGSGVDNIFYTGDITDWTQEGPGDVTIDGEAADPGGDSGSGGSDEEPKELRLNAVGESAKIIFTVSGDLQEGEDFNAGTDSINGSTGTSTIGGSGSDNYFFTGEITDFSLEGPAEVYIDGVFQSDLSSGSSGGGGGSSGDGNGVAILIFDDGNDSHLLKAAPIMDNFGYPGTAAIITTHLKEDSGWSSSNLDGSKAKWTSYLTNPQLEYLQDRYDWEIGSHTVNHDKLAEMSFSRAVDELEDSKADLEALGFDADSFVYPKGSGNSRLADAVGDAGYEVGFGGGGQTWPSADSRYRIGRYAAQDRSEVLNAIDRESSQDGVVPIMFHEIVDSGASGNQITTGRLREYCEEIEDAGMDVMTATEWVRTL